MSEKTSKNNGVKLLLMSTVMALIIVIALLVLFSYLSKPDLIQYLGGATAAVIPNNTQNLDSTTSIILGDLTRRGYLISLDDIWTFQGSFYQTIITFLIAINGLLAGLAVVYIRTSSHEKAEDKAETTIEKYVGSNEFKLRIDKKVDELTIVGRTDIERMVGDVESHIENINKNHDESIHLNKELIELKRQIRIISNKVAIMDTDDADGSELSLIKGE